MKAIDAREAANRQLDRLMASASRTMPETRPGEQPGDPITVIAAAGWYLSFGPVDIQAVINELELGAPCGICHGNPCVRRAKALS